jgi:hypothetical protein
MPEIVKKIHKLVVDDHRLKEHKLADMVSISKKCCTSHMTENLNIRKPWAIWVPRLLTIE